MLWSSIEHYAANRTSKSRRRYPTIGFSGFSVPVFIRKLKKIISAFVNCVGVYVLYPELQNEVQ